MMRSAIQEELDKNGITVCTTRGDSMEPLLANRRDIVTIQKIEPGQRLKKYDVPLYRRDGGENYVLHRILKVREQDYVICGDNRWRPEYGIMDRHLVGVMTGIVRKGKEVPLDGNIVCMSGYGAVFFRCVPSFCFYGMFSGGS